MKSPCMFTKASDHCQATCVLLIWDITITTYTMSPLRQHGDSLDNPCMWSDNHQSSFTACLLEHYSDLGVCGGRRQQLQLPLAFVPYTRAVIFLLFLSVIFFQCCTCYRCVQSLAHLEKVLLRWNGSRQTFQKTSQKAQGSSVGPWLTFQ